MCTQHHNVPLAAPAAPVPAPQARPALSAGGPTLSQGIVEAAKPLVYKALTTPAPQVEAPKPAPVATPAPRVEAPKPVASIPDTRNAIGASVSAAMAPKPEKEAAPRSMRFHLNKAWKTKIAQRRGQDITLKGGHVVQLEIVGNECELKVIRLNGTDVPTDAALTSLAQSWLNR